MVPVPIPTEVLEWSSSKHHAEDESYSEFFSAGWGQDEAKDFFPFFGLFKVFKGEKRIFYQPFYFLLDHFADMHVAIIFKILFKIPKKQGGRNKSYVAFETQLKLVRIFESNTLMKQGFFPFPRPFQRRDEEFCRQLLLITVYRGQDEDFSPHFEVENLCFAKKKVKFPSGNNCTYCMHIRTQEPIVKTQFNRILLETDD